MRLPPAAAVLIFLSACGDKENGADAGVVLDLGVDAGVIADSGLVADSGADGGEPERDAEVHADATIRDGAIGCPPASSYIGDPSWPATLTAGPTATLCQYPAMFTDVRDALAQKAKLHLVEGTYKLPLAATDEPLLIPACFSDLPSPPAIEQGTVDAARVMDINNPVEQYAIDATFPLSDNTELRMSIIRPLNAPDFTFDDAPIDTYGAIQAKQCTDGTCFHADDKFFIPCRMTPRMCDRFVFQDGAIDIDQFHWHGVVGSGFASPQRVRGTFRNQPLDITAYEQMTLAYGHHAFLRTLIVFFDAPIEGICGLHIAEISESSPSTNVELINCDASVIATSPVTSSEHLFGMRCP